MLKYKFSLILTIKARIYHYKILTHDLSSEFMSEVVNFPYKHLKYKIHEFYIVNSWICEFTSSLLMMTCKKDSLHFYLHHLNLIVNYSTITTNSRAKDQAFENWSLHDPNSRVIIMNHSFKSTNSQATHII